MMKWRIEIVTSLGYVRLGDSNCCRYGNFPCVKNVFQDFGGGFDPVNFPLLPPLNTALLVFGVVVLLGSTQSVAASCLLQAFLSQCVVYSLAYATATGYLDYS